jgi:endonuclease III
MDNEKALKQLRELEKLNKKPRLAAENWGDEWKTLIAILLSARTRDEKTIKIAEELFKKYTKIEKIVCADIKEIEKSVRGVNYYKTKAQNISKLSKKIVKEFNGKIPDKFDELITLPGVGRKTANVYLAEKGKQAIGVDTHITRISNFLGWTKHKEQKKIEDDLKKIFPKKIWKNINYTLVGFGRSYPKKEQEKMLRMIKRIK